MKTKLCCLLLGMLIGARDATAAFCRNDPVNSVDPLGLAGYFFDGTGNIPEDNTNVRRLHDLYVGSERFYAYGLGSGYHADGTAYNKITGGLARGYEGASGADMKDRVKFMMKKLKARLEAGDKIVDVFGFSRGAATATRFLHAIHRKMKSGDPLYRGINIRFVALFDQVPTDYYLGEHLAGNYLDLLGMQATLGRWRPNTYARHASDRKFLLPKGMKFDATPMHLIAIDERRKEFAVTDFGDRALQVGFRGVHSDGGGGYGGNIFEFITLNFVLDQAKERKLDIFDRVRFHGSPIYLKQHAVYEEMKAGRYVSGMDPTENSDWKFNDDERRHLPKGMLLHESVDWFSSKPLNSIEGFGRY